MKTTAYIATSVDGYIARENGDVSWLDQYSRSSDEDYGFQAFFDSVDALIMGRKTFEKVLSFEEWPYADKPVVVLTHGNLTIPEHLAPTVETMAGTPAQVVDQLAQRGYQHLYLDGGVTIQGFIAAGLVDALILTRVPVLLGSGIPLFGELPQEIALQHLSTQSFANGLIQSTYHPV